MFNSLVALHVLLAPKSFSTNIAVVKGRRVAPLRGNGGYFQILHWIINYLMNEKVVRF